MNDHTNCKTECIVDLCGTYGYGSQANFWADYCPEHKVTIFGGDWGDCPPIEAPAEPTQEQCYAWARAHGWSAHSMMKPHEDHTWYRYYTPHVPAGI